jgi:sugar/nucleoside kinase (ribokinase family)
VLIRAQALAVAVADTLGACDAVIGAVLAGLVLGQDPVLALESGLTLAAKSCAHEGAFGYGVTIDPDWPHW